MNLVVTLKTESYHKPMKNIVLSLLVICVASPALAQEARVIKVKGQQAIVTFPNGVKPQVGQMIDLNAGTVDGGSSMGTGSRDFTVGGSASLSFLNNSSTSKSTTLFAIEPRFGWNMKQMEFGPTAILSYSSTDGRTIRIMGAGGFFDFNFVPNVSKTQFVYGVGGDLKYYQTSDTVAGTETSTTDLVLFGGGQAKYFLFSDNVAVRGDVGYYYDRNTTPSTSSNNSGLLAKVGFYYYY